MKPKPRETPIQAARRVIRNVRRVHDLANAARLAKQEEQKLAALVTSLLEHRALCLWCHEPLTPKTLTLDHRTPLSRGGQATLENIEPVCRRCNKLKGKLTAQEYEKLCATLGGLSDEARRDIERRLLQGGIVYRSQAIRRDQQSAGLVEPPTSAPACPPTLG